ncbi:hypothetical protein KIPB_012003, partial [Kipferlia bialata]
PVKGTLPLTNPPAPIVPPTASGDLPSSVKNVQVSAQPASVRRHTEETKGTPLDFKSMAEDALHRRLSVLRLSQRGRLSPDTQAGEETLPPAEEKETLRAQPDTDTATDTDSVRERETRDGEAAGQTLAAVAEGQVLSPLAEKGVVSADGGSLGHTLGSLCRTAGPNTYITQAAPVPAASGILPSSVPVRTEVSSLPALTARRDTDTDLRQEDPWARRSAWVTEHNQDVARAEASLRRHRTSLRERESALEQRESALEQRERALEQFKSMSKSLFPTETQRQQYFAAHGLDSGGCEGLLQTASPVSDPDYRSGYQVLSDQNRQLLTQVASLRSAPQSAMASAEEHRSHVTQPQVTALMRQLEVRRALRHLCI